MNKKEKAIYEEIINNPDPVSILIMMNQYDIISSYVKKGIKIDKILIEVAKYLQENKYRIPSGGYINLLKNLK